MEETDYKKHKESKKEIKWYTYVDQKLEDDLNAFVEKYQIKSKAKVIREAVRLYLNYVDKFKENTIPDIEQGDDFDYEMIENFVNDAIKNFQIINGLYEELKQKISPLKLLIFMLEDFEKSPEKLNDDINKLKRAISELENTIKVRFDETIPFHPQEKYDIMYIEDNSLDRETIKMYFENKQFSINCVETSEEALDLLKSSLPKIILLDLELKTSKIQGQDFCKHIKSNINYRDIPVIVMSAHISKLNKRRFLIDTKSDDLIIKPISKLADLDIVIDYINKNNKKS